MGKASKARKVSHTEKRSEKNQKDYKREKKADIASGKQRKRSILTGLGGAAVLLAICYGCGVFYYKDKFFDGTQINQIACENLTVQEAEEKIKAKVEEYALELLFKENKKEKIRAEDINYQYVSDGSIEKFLKKQNPFFWPSGFFKEEKYQAGTEIRYDEEKLKEKIESFSSMKEENMSAPKDAYIAFEENQFVIKEETQGTALDKEKAIEEIKKAISTGKKSFSAEKAGVYKKPAVTKEDEGLQRQQKSWNECAAVTVTYTFGDKTEVLDGMVVKDWLTYDENGNYVENLPVLQEKIRAYVKALAEKYNTVGRNRTITSTATGQPVTVEGGSYGYLIDQPGERAQLLADIQVHAVTKREPVYARTGKTYGDNDIGNTYVEIDLTGQHLWYYKDGKILMDSDFVSGTYYNAGRRTPGGSYYLAYKQRDQVLRPAPNPDGSYDYESPVSYWMPFNGGIGLHDANWRWSFGGSIYLYSGSHGCINLPPSFAGKLYENIEAGCPVICFYR